MFSSSWLIVLFLLLLLIMFAIFWLMKNQSPKMPYEQKKIEVTSQQHYEDEISSKIKQMPHPKVHNEFFEVSSENKPLPDDKILMAHMKNKIDLVKKHGIPPKEKTPKHIEQAVDEILQQEFERRSPEFRGEKKTPNLLPTHQEAEIHLQTLDKNQKPKKKTARKKKAKKSKKKTTKKSITKKKPRSKRKKQAKKKSKKSKKKTTKKKPKKTKKKTIRKKNKQTKKRSKPKKRVTKKKPKKTKNIEHTFGCC